MPEVLRMFFKRVHEFLKLLFGRMRLAQKLMLIYSLVLGATIFTFAGQLISVANNSTETAFLKDTQKLLKESRNDIESKMDICSRAISALTGDYDLMSYIRDWDKGDKTSIFDFSQSLRRKFEQIRFLSPDIYQFRVYVSNKNFPEIGSDVYGYDRLENSQSLVDKLYGHPHGYWNVSHAENNYNTGVLERRKVVSLYVPLRFSRGKDLGIVEAAMPVETFFRSMFSQTENKNLFAFAVDSDDTIIFDLESEFSARYELDAASLGVLLKDAGIKEGNGVFPIEINDIRMNMVYDYLDRLDCTICYIVTNENITSKLENTKILIIAESLLSLLILSVLIYFLTRIVFKKMKQIIDLMRRVEEGKLDGRVAISGQDEMSEMAYHFNRMLNRLGGLISEVIKKQEAKKNAEIRALFAQINSHFIVNTLENIRMLAEIDSKLEIADAITSLGKLLRYGLKWTTQYAALGEEIEYIKNYIALANIRYDFSIELKTDIPPELMTYKVLKVSLQPMVENAIHRGIEPLARDGLLTIRACADTDYTIIEIEDNGIGMDEEQLNNVKCGIYSEIVPELKGSGGNGIGLRNVHERIKLVYGERYGLDITSRKNEYTKVIMRLPATQQS